MNKKDIYTDYVANPFATENQINWSSFPHRLFFNFDLFSLYLTFQGSLSIVFREDI